MERLLPWIDPIRLADEGARLCGVVPASDMPRLVQSVVNHAPDVAVDLVFSRAQDGFRRMQGQVHVAVGLSCERCLERLEVVLNSQVEVIWLRPGQSEAGMPEEYDMMTATEAVSLVELVEEELLLGLPMYPAHAAGGCRPPKPLTDVVANRPFEALKKLKGKSSGD